MPDQTPNISPLDQAFAEKLEGNYEEALRQACDLVELADYDAAAAFLLADLLRLGNRVQDAAKGFEAAVEASIRRGDFAMAVVAAKALESVAGDADKQLLQIAMAFGKGSARLDDVPQAPPPLPPSLPPEGGNARNLTDAALLDHASKVLATFLAGSDPLPENQKLPALPLFASLESGALFELISAFETLEITTGGVVVEQHSEGHEGYVVARGALEVFRQDNEGTQTTLAALGPGAIFGEMALVSDAPRAAGVRAMEPALLLVVHRDALERLAEDQPIIGEELGRFCQHRMVSNLIRHSAILKAVDPSARTDLIARFAPRTFTAGQVLVEQGNEPEGLYLIASGGVEVRSADADGDTLKIAELGPGDVVGEISLVLRRPASADVVAIHQTVALQLQREEFQDTIREHPGLLSELYELAAKRDEETKSVVGLQALDVEDAILI